MIVLGLTGSIAMGKSTTAQMFRDAGIPVHDADAVVHALYEGEAVPLIEARFPGSTDKGKVDRQALARFVLEDENAMADLESIVHPLVRRAEQDFIRLADGSPFVILDIPLLFETGADHRVDGVIVVTAPPQVQAERALARPGMTRAKLDAILRRQTPDEEKRARADFIIDTSHGLDAARIEVKKICQAVQSGAWQPKTKSADKHR